jgi:sugar lactone lactonase YvrE
MLYKPELVFYSGSTLLEGPVWDATHNSIVCVSIEQELIYQIRCNTGQIKTFKTEGAVGCVVKKSDDKYWSAEKGGIFEIDIKSGSRSLLINPISNSLLRLNDGKLDPIGRFIFGSMGHDIQMDGANKVYSFDGNLCKVIIENVTISNGIAFSSDGLTMYYIDTPTKKVSEYNYKIETGEAEFQKYLFEISGEGFPDGMCVDIDGMLWVAEWGGGKVCKWNPKTLEKLLEIIIPCTNVTSCCLGSSDLNYLYVTTAINKEIYEPLAGGLFRIKIR